MRLIVTDVVTVSAIQSAPLRPKMVVEVDERMGAELLNRLPDFFRVDAKAEAVAPAKPRRKAKPAAPHTGD